MLEKRVATDRLQIYLKLPKTDFPMKANLPRREPEMLNIGMNSTSTRA